jgi:hypothetical protein
MNRTKNNQNKERLLLNRKKNVDVYLLPSGRQFRAVAEMKDGVHHMRINMVVNQPSLRIKEIECEMLGVPDSICRDARTCLEPLIGKRVVPGILRGMDQMVRKGCTHLINLFHEACYNLTQAQGVYGKEDLAVYFPGITDGKEDLAVYFPGITEEQIFKIFFWFRPEIMNSCVRYSKDSPFMQKVEQVEVTEKAEKLRLVAKMK